MFRTIALIATFLVATPLVAQTARDCDGWQGHARNIAEPWESHIRTFANNRIRVALLDTIEPAAGAFYILVLSPPYGELGDRACVVVGDHDGGIGFAGITFEELGASYDPARGLTLTAPVTRYQPETAGFDSGILSILINQSTGQVTPSVEIR